MEMWALSFSGILTGGKMCKKPKQTNNPDGCDDMENWDAKNLKLLLRKTRHLEGRYIVKEAHQKLAPLSFEIEYKSDDFYEIKCMKCWSTCVLIIYL